MHTNDGGQSWHRQQATAPFDLQGVQFLDAQRGYIVGDNGTLLETVDGGETWETLYDPGNEGGAAKRLMYGEDVAPMIGWKLAGGHYDLHFPTPNDGWAVGLNSKVIHTGDGGNMWIGQSLGMMEDFDMRVLYSLHFADNQTGWVVGEGGKLLKTTDGGLTWMADSISPNQLMSVFFIDDQTGWVSGDEGAVLATKDGGETWVEQLTPTNKALLAIYFLNANEGWTVGGEGTILHTTDGGVTWIAQQSPTRSSLSDITQTADGTLWVVGEWGSILKY